LPGDAAGQFFWIVQPGMKKARPPTGEQSETASFTPFALARCENGAGARCATRD
jgi:hypothetical protein